MPHTPATEARRTVSRLSTCETPRLPHPKPPSGQADRIQSITVHSAAITTALTNGRPGRRQMGTSKPKIPTPRASTIVRPVHANAPNRKIQ